MIVNVHVGKGKLFLVACLVFFSVFFVHRPLRADEAVIKDLLVTTDQQNLLLYARVKNCFNSDMEDAVLAGVPATITFEILLYRERSWLPDKKMKGMTISHTIKYDNIKKIFNVSIDDEKTWENFSDFESAKRTMVEINALSLEKLSVLTKNSYFVVKLRAKLDKVRLPLHLEYLFFLASLWDFETGWYQQRFLF